MVGHKKGLMDVIHDPSGHFLGKLCLMLVSVIAKMSEML